MKIRKDNSSTSSNKIKNKTHKSAKLKLKSTIETNQTKGTRLYKPVQSSGDKTEVQSGANKLVKGARKQPTDVSDNSMAEEVQKHEINSTL